MPWWPRPDVKLFNILVHVVAETNRHAGHADILRELIDGAAGQFAGDTNVTQRSTDEWAAHRARIEAAAQRFR